MTTPDHLSRRTFVKTAAAVGAAGFAGHGLVASARGAGSAAGRASEIRIGLIGCGGRGTGAAMNAVEASPDTRIVALADVFSDRLAGSRSQLAGRSDRAGVPEARCFSGFDAYEKLLALPDVDLVILATPPHFRPMHFEAAVAADKHVFMEKPVAVDPAGVRRVMAAGDSAMDRGLSVVAGTQRRHERSYLTTIDRIRSGLIGDVVSASCYWNQGGLWMKPRQDGWSDMEWQLRNWLYFTWLSGDHIVEQHVHNLDVCNWVIGSHPIRATGMGGRQVRTDPAYGHIFDHFAVEYEYPGGVTMTSFCRQQDGTSSRVGEVIRGSKGICSLNPGQGSIEGEHEWYFDGENPNPYVQEHVDLHDSVRSGAGLNEARTVAEATMTAILGRLSAYTGRTLEWQSTLEADLDLSPGAYVMGDLPVPPVAVPGRTRLAGR
jgi:predicted dehydrogenase